MKDFSNIRFKWTFRDYQQKILDNSKKYLIDKKMHIVAAPGSGKTVLGLELIRRLNAPALVLSPSVTIRGQWGERFAECYMPEGESFEEYISYNLSAPKLITSITYQALHAAVNKTIVSDDIEDEEVVSEEKQDYSALDLMKIIKDSKITTICLDEAHHLKSEWQKALELFVQKLGDSVTIISLTATPPYDSQPAEWNRYITLCGDIDEEIFVPELVVQKTLCPHQDFILFNYPTNEEAEILSSYRSKVKKCINILIENKIPYYAIEKSGIQNQSDNSEELLYNNINEFIALLKFASVCNEQISKTLIKKVFNSDSIPKCTFKDMEYALQFIIDNKELFGDEVYGNTYNLLSEYSLIEKKKVQLITSDKLSKMLISSMGKLNSINTICECEYDSLGNSLRMLILTDYIKKDIVKLIGTNAEIQEMGAVPIFEYLRRNINSENKIALLSGSVVILPNSALNCVAEISDNMSIGYKVKPIINTKHSEVYFEGSNKNKVAIITKAFGKGVINTLVGTKALLGEGWDSPNINSLILASFVGSFMLSNQMRGRAIRIDKQNPKKVSNIWHLVTVDEDEFGNISSNEIFGDDYDTVKRRFDCFQAPAYNTNVIVNTIDRLDIIKPPFNKEAFDNINNKMLELSKNRSLTENGWSYAVKGKSHPEVVEEIEIMSDVIPKSVAISFRTKAIVFAIAAIIGIIIMSVSEFIGSLFGFVVSLISIIMMIGSYFNYKKYSSQEKVISIICNALLSSLKEIGEISTDNLKLIIKKSNNLKSINCCLKNASIREKSIFSNALSQMLSPIDNPRYVLVNKKNNTNNYEFCFACPDIFGNNKDKAKVLSDKLKLGTNVFSLIFTRNEPGNKQLIDCKKYSYTNKNGKAVKIRRVVD